MTVLPAHVPTLAIFRAIGTKEMTAEQIREAIRNAPDLEPLRAELDHLVGRSLLKSRDPGNRQPRLYSLAALLAIGGGVDRLAHAIDTDRRRIETTALLAMGGVIARTKTHARSAYRMGQDAGRAASDTLRGNGIVTGLLPLVARYMLVANLAARQRLGKVASRAGANGVSLAEIIAPGDATEAAETARYERATQQYVDRIALPAADRIRLATASTMRVSPGLSVAESAIGDALEATGVASATKGYPVGPWAIRQLLGYLIGLAYSDGQRAVTNNPAVASLMAGWTYTTREDNRVRPFHRMLHGMTRPTDDPIWLTVTPPSWEHDGEPQWGCRCWRVPRFGKVAFTPVPAAL